MASHSIRSSKASNSGSTSAILFRDTFTVESRDADGKKLPTCKVNKNNCKGCKACKVPHFNEVSRYDCNGDTYHMKLTIDVACKIFPLEKNDSIVFALARTLKKDGSTESEDFDQSGKDSHLNDFDYGMFGRVFKYEHDPEDKKKVCIYASFGGLLMKIHGPQEHLATVELDSNVYCLIRKINSGS